MDTKIRVALAGAVAAVILALGTASAVGHEATIEGNNGDNDCGVLNGHEHRDLILGYGGDDCGVGFAEDDTLRMGENRDLGSGRAQDDKLAGNQGNDRKNIGGSLFGLDGGDGNDDLYGGEDDDVLYGGDGRDLIVGEEGNDDLVGRGDGEADTIRGGGGGNDFCYADFRDDPDGACETVIY